VAAKNSKIGALKIFQYFAFQRFKIKIH
jgi:hypothetical protein